MLPLINLTSQIKNHPISYGLTGAFSNSDGAPEMDGFGSNQRTHAVDQWMEIVNGKGYSVGGATHIYSTRPGLPDFQQSIPPPPWTFTAARTNAPSRLLDAETKRKKRIMTYKAYAMEGKVKSTVKKGFRWIKNRCSQIVHGQ